MGFIFLSFVLDKDNFLQHQNQACCCRHLHQRKFSIAFYFKTPWPIRCAGLRSQ